MNGVMQQIQGKGRGLVFGKEGFNVSAYGGMPLTRDINANDGAYGIQYNKALTLPQEIQTWPQRSQSFFSSIRMNKNSYNHTADAEDKQADSKFQRELFKEITNNAGHEESFADINDYFSDDFKFFIAHQDKAYHGNEGLSNAVNSGTPAFAVWLRRAGPP